MRVLASPGEYPGMAETVIKPNFSNHSPRNVCIRILVLILSIFLFQLSLRLQFTQYIPIIKARVEANLKTFIV